MSAVWAIQQFRKARREPRLFGNQAGLYLTNLIPRDFPKSQRGLLARLDPEKLGIDMQRSLLSKYGLKAEPYTGIDMRVRIAFVCVVIVSVCVCQGALVVADDFNRGDSTSLGTVAVGGFSWNEQETSASGLQVFGNRLVAGSTNAGREYATVNLSSTVGYSTKLDANVGLVTWAINMRQSRSDPAGFDAGIYGLAFVLAASSADYSTGKGYAVVLGQSGATDSIRLARFSSGLAPNSSFADVISGGDYGSEYLSIRVTYDPAGSQWALYLASSVSSFSDPTAVTTQVGATTTDSTYTGSALNYAGVLWNHNTSGSESALFDNFSISTVPEPVSLALGAFGLISVGTWVSGRFLSRGRSQRGADMPCVARYS